MNKGFTLIEIMVTVSIFTVLIFGAALMVNDIFVNSNQSLLAMSNIDQARLALTTFTNEIRNAIAGSDGSYPLNQTGDNQIVFYSNFKSENGTVDRIRYFILGDTLYKGVVKPSGDTLTYELDSESIKTVQEGIANESVPLFSYYNGDYNGVGQALLQPVNVTLVKFVKINLIVKKNSAPNDTSTFSATAGAAIRSVKDNLGG